MRFSWVLPLAALSTAIVIPDEQVLQELAIEKQDKYHSLVGSVQSAKDKVTDYIKGEFQHVTKSVDQYFDELVAQAEEKAEHLHSTLEDSYYAVDNWVNSAVEGGDDHDHDHGGPPHHGPPHHGPPHHGPPHHGPPHHGPPHHGPPHHGEPNLTIYELISKSKYTTKLAKLISEDEDLVKLLNSTKANHTVFAPTDYAFSKISDDAKKPSKEVIKDILLYHVVPGVYPAGRVLYSKSFPTLLKEKLLGDKPQRLSAQVGLRGVTINFYSRVVAINIPATNGIIHGVDSIILPPPKALKILSLLPAEFSTLLYGLGKTGLIKHADDEDHVGGTYFAPSNRAFEKLGPRINAFLFSDRGEKYLKALLLYHTSLNHTLYSTAYYNSTSEDHDELAAIMTKRGTCHKKQGRKARASTTAPYLHVDLPTLLEGKSLAIDIARYGPFVEVKINAFARVEIADGVAKDGVIHVPSNVLIPPRTLGGAGSKDLAFWMGEEMSVEELVERLEPFVEKEEKKEEEKFQWEF